MDPTTSPEPDDTEGRLATSPAPLRSRRSLLVVLWVIAAFVYVLDRGSKWLALRHLSTDEPVQVVGRLLQLRLLFNPGAAFSMATGMTWLLTLLAVGVVVVIVRVSRRLGSRGWALALGLLLGGALGNLTDRLVRPPGFGRGHVVDFVQLPNFPVFNVADSAITVAAVCVVLLSLRGVGLDGRREHGHRREGSDA
ncbi:MAG: signal peptidase II [Actinomycetes bacterium]